MKVVFLGQGKAQTMLMFANCRANTVEGNPRMPHSGRWPRGCDVYIPAADPRYGCFGQILCNPGLAPARA